MLKPREALLVALCCAWVTSLTSSGDLFPAEPKISSENGNLVFSTPQGKNISFRTGSGRGGILLNGEDVASVLQTVKDASTRLAPILQPEQIGPFRDALTTLRNLQSLVNTLLRNSTDLRRQVSRMQRLSIRSLQRNFQGLRNTVNELQTTLQRDECSSNPCRNGGTCVDLYDRYLCLCYDTWEGQQCDVDVDECRRYGHSDLGCQNGATCVNTPGAYRCECAPGYHGVSCTEQHDECSSASSAGLCGHGTCISQKKDRPDQLGYTCICDQGWAKKTTGNDPACTEDVDECATGRHFCSRQPAVSCVNYPGGFTCAPCPAGYSGDGFTCTDVDECLVNNGGCSTNPRVDCINVQGSRVCGPCPPGYIGDGVHCTFVGLCHSNNGGCSPLAVCIAHSESFRECRCPTGFIGSGIGPGGCVPTAPGAVTPATPTGTGSPALPGIQDPCTSNPCQHGFCLPRSTIAGLNDYFCSCRSGYTGRFCDSFVDSCSSNPCLNNGTCVNQADGYRCTCTAEWTGSECQDPRQDCGGALAGSNGTLVYPQTADTYSHRRHCVWVIIAESGKVLNVTFTRFNLEESHQCEFDFLTVYDGHSMAGNARGRYCGTQLLGKNITSTHDALTLWFKSDHSVGGEGFALNWTSVDPVCGANLPEADVGSVQSPGYPGLYPSLRDCYWTVTVPVGKKIQMHFASLQLEHHPNCSYDFLKIYDGSSDRDEVLGNYCSTGIPAPVVTSGHTALLYFHTDGSDSDTGFHLAYASVPGVAGCGGVETRPEGRFSSPNYPQPYLHGLRCEWEIRAPVGERLQLTFESFHLEGGPSCRYDYVEVYDGRDDTAELSGRYCASTGPPPITSSTNKLFVRFVTDNSHALPGFTAIYSAICGGRYTDLNGTLTSPGFPDEYEANKGCNYTIEVPPGYVVQLTFHVMDTEAAEHCQFDYIHITEPSRNGTAELGRYCGQTVPDPITSSLNHMSLYFHSDHSVHKQGFYANYTTIDTGCGGVVTRPGSLQSPATDLGSYPHATTCNWVLRAPPGFVVRLAFSQFILESGPNCRHDSLEVHDSSGHLVGTYCGTEAPPQITSTAETLYVTFKTDDSVAHDGFAASVEFINATSFCGREYYISEGVIRSPGFPGPYPSTRDCTWIIRAPEGQQIRINFTLFQLEGPPCTYDYLEIRNGADNLSPLAGVFCARDPPQGFVSYSNVLRLRFVTDDSVSGEGFELFYDTALTGCGGEASGTSGHIKSPNYPQPYGHNADCSWTIRVSKGSVISLAIVDIDIEQHHTCNYDFLEIYDGPSSTAPRLARLCNSQQITQHLQSTDSVLFLKFRTDSSSAGRGFHIAYAAECNHVIKNKRRGVIESPNYPQPYSHNFNCTWTIEATRGNNVSLAFSHFDLEHHENCTYDYLEINETKTGDESPPRRMAKLCGNTMPTTFVSSGNIVSVRFVTDRSQAADGFRLEYAWQGCGGELRKPWGTLETPNYPNGYPHDTECLWHINAPAGKRIELNFHDFSMEHAHGCRFDFVRVYGGRDTTSPLLTEICQSSENPTTLTSTGDAVTIHFSSDNSIAGKGFRASYRTIDGGCGGSYRTSSTTMITSPGYPSNYDSTDDCLYTLRAQAGHVVLLNILDFDVPASTNCSQSYLLVTDYVNGERRELLKQCGDKVPEPSTIRSTGNKMDVRLKAGGDVAGRGFKANFTQGCGATLSADEPGAITSFNYPHFSISQAGAYCTWLLITNSTNEKVSLTVTHVETTGTDCSRRNVTIRNGPDADSPIHRTLCTNYAPPTITSFGSALYVQAYSTIFRAVYSTFSSSCGGTLEATRGGFSSPNYPLSYPVSRDCIWTIKASAGNYYQLSFLMFNMEESEFCAEDYVEIRERNSGGPLVGRFCGSQVPANVTQAPGFWIKFHSDEEGTGDGFAAEFALVPNVSLDGNSGAIESPGYPRQTTYGGRLTWTLRVDPSLYPRISVETFFIMPAFCDENALEIFEGEQGDAFRAARICGSQTPAPIVLRSNVAFFTFQATHAMYHWRLKWEAVNDTFFPNMTTARCGKVVTLRNATHKANVTSPGYPNSYDAYLECSWTVTAPLMRRVTFKFDALNMSHYVRRDAIRGRCYYDMVNIYDVTTWARDERPLVLSACGRPSVLPSTITSSGQALVVTMETSTAGGVGAQGFTAIVSSVCGGNVTHPTEEITDGDLLPSETDCQWLINPGRRRKLKFTFENYDIPSSDGVCRDSYVQVLNGDSDDAPPLGQGKFCGSSRSPQELPQTSSDKAFIVYRSSQGGDRFKLRWEEVSPECGGRVQLTTHLPQHAFHSPGYPHQGPPHSVECNWLIEAPPGKRIRIDFPTQIHMKEGCRNEDALTDFVRVLDGGTQISPTLGVFCGEDRVSSVLSMGNLVLMQFVQTGSGDDYVGFSAEATIGDCGGTLGPSSRYLEQLREKLRSREPFDCSWQLTGTPYSKISLTFRNLSLHESEGCSGTDYLEARDGTATGPVISRHCGANLSDVVISSEDRMFLRVKSRGPPAQSVLLHIYWRPQHNLCGGQLSMADGSLETPRFPAMVRGRVVCRWSISGLQGRRVTLNIVEGDISSCASKIQITETFLSTVVPCNASLPYVYESFSQSIMVSFETEGAAAVHGFRAYYNTDKELPCFQELEDRSGDLVPNPEALRASRPSMCQWSVMWGINTTLVYNVKDANVTIDNPNCRNEFFRQDRSVCKRGQRAYALRSGGRKYTMYYVKKHTEASGGINVSYKLNECGGSIIVGEEPITRTSPEFPSEYPRNTDCVWYIRPSVWNAQIQLNFTSFQLEDNCTKDYVDILSGAHLLSPSIDKYCGSRRPPLLRSAEFTVIFHTDDSGAATGFNFTLSLSGEPCGGYLHVAYRTTVMSPNYPQPYPPNTWCEWILDAQRGHHVNITFVDRFDVQSSTACAKDYVKVENETPSGRWSPQTIYCGLHTHRPLLSRSHRVRLLFVSDGSIQGDGFKAVVSLACGDNYTDPEGMITSPRFPSDYAAGLDCKYLIVVPPGAHVEIGFDRDNFDIEEWNDCIYDSLTLYSGETDTAPQILRTCGTVAPGNLTVASSVLVRFKTDWSVGGKGFVLYYSIMECGGNLTAPTGTFGVLSKRRQAGCTWYITVDPEKAVEVRFLTLTGGWGDPYRNCTEEYDSIQVYDNDPVTMGSRLLYGYCGSGDSWRTTVSNSNSVRVVLNAGWSNLGFKAIYRATLGPRQGCGGTVRLADNNHARIHWPKDPGQYPNDVNCVWRVVGSPGKELRLNFTAFDVQEGSDNNTTCSSDFVEVWDTLLDRDRSVERYCGSTLPPSLFAAGNVLTLHFFSDSQVTRSGFQAVIDQVPPTCGGHLRSSDTEVQEVTSPGFPSGAAANVQCLWHIDGRAVVHFHNFHIPCETGADLTFVYQHSSDPPVQFCGDSVPHTLQSVSYRSREGAVVFKSGTVADRSLFKFTFGEPLSENRTYTHDSGFVCNVDSPYYTKVPAALPLILNIAPSTRGGTLALYFLDFAVGTVQNGSCPELAMDVRDGAAMTSRVLGTLCGHTSPQPLYSTSDRVTLVLRRVGRVMDSRPGREYKLSMVYMSSTEGAGCGGNLTHTQGALASPGFPEPLREAKTCRWYLGVPGRGQMSLGFKSFALNSSLGCQQNYLELYEGHTESPQSFVTRFCGEDHPAPYESRGNKILLKLVSSGPNSGPGFFATFRAKTRRVTSTVMYVVGDV